MPRIHTLTPKKKSEDKKRPGMNADRPRNSRLYPCDSQSAYRLELAKSSDEEKITLEYTWPRTQKTAAAMPKVGFRINEDEGR